MRPQASTLALLALTGLLALPSAAARPKHHPAPKRAVPRHPAPQHPAPQHPAHKPKRRGKRPVDDSQADPITMSRVHAWLKHQQQAPAPAANRPIATAKPSPRPSAPETASPKATSTDFLKAAESHPTPAGSEALKPAAPTQPVSKPLDDEAHLAIAAPSEPAAPGAIPTAHSRPSPTPRSPTSVSIVHPTPAPPQPDSIAGEAAAPIILPPLYNKRGRLVMPAPLKGSREILLHQNEVADQDGLDRIQDDDDLNLMREKKVLVPLPVSAAMHVDERLAPNRRFCRPWTAQFLTAIARAHYARFHTPLQINSAVRTVAYQLKLQRTNGNAAPAEGDTASPHLTGQTIDLAKKGLPLSEIAWMRGYLLPLVQQGKIDVEEEFQQSCFHISVYKKYLPPAPSPRHLAETPPASTAVLATALP